MYILTAGQQNIYERIYSRTYERIYDTSYMQWHRCDIKHVLANISRSRYVSIATQPVHRLQIRPIVWACGCRQTDRQTHRRAWSQYIARRLRLTRNVITLAAFPVSGPRESRELTAIIVDALLSLKSSLLCILTTQKRKSLHIGDFPMGIPTSNRPILGMCSPISLRNDTDAYKLLTL